MRIDHLLTQARERLAVNHAALLSDAHVILSRVLSVDRGYLYSHPEFEVPTEKINDFNALLSRRREGEPLAYLMQHREFWSLDFKVSPATLIPRPETECVVEQALALLAVDEPLEVLDLGTGCGAIAIALAKECPYWSVYASEKSQAALALAKENAERLGLDNITLIESDWFQHIGPRRFKAILSNPPYVAHDDPALEANVAAYEPSLALYADDNGLAAIKFIIEHAPDYLQSNGYLIIEHGCQQMQQVVELLEKKEFTAIVNYKDYAGLARVTVAKWLS